ncbi:ESPR-type extended signal peptide-containing protein, partial [Rodentibacter sp. Ppn85]|uniref:ESPR-type extended signal peptide-containing protein n=1 Tax=Rodentibacter sp. Ppn85 TaxID=1908525 RepID=UPI002101B9B1
MNKIFKVIWNQSLGAWVAASELAKGYGKSSSTTQTEQSCNISEKELKTFSLSKVSLSVLALLSVGNSAFAAIGSQYHTTGAWDTISIGERDPKSKGAKVGTGSEDNIRQPSSVANSVAIGGSSTIMNTKRALALGYESKVTNGKEGGVALGAFSTVGGTNTGAETKSVTLNGANYTYFAQPDNNTAVLSIGSGKNGRQQKYRQIQNVAAGRVAEDSSDAINGSQLYAVVRALGNVSGGGTSGLTNFVVGADKNHSANGINVTKDSNRFDVISGDENYLTTAVDGNNIKVDLSQKSKNAIDNVSKNTQNITKNAQNITNNAQNITKNTQNITKNAGDIAKGFGLKAQDNQTVNKKLGEFVEVIGGNSNINTTVSNGKIKVNLNNSLDLGNNGNVKIGGTGLNSTGLTINNGPSVTNTGINAGNKKVTNVSDGIISNSSKEAVNGSQLYATNQNITNVTNNVTNLKNDVAKGWNITTSKSGTGNVSGNNLTKVAMGDTVTIDAGNNINITQSGKKVTIATSSTPNFSSVNTGSLTVRPSGNVNFGGNVLTNVGAPTNNTDAANKQYVDEGRTKVTSNDGTVKITESGDKQKVYDLSVNISNVSVPQNIKYKGDTGSGSSKLSEELHFKGSDLVKTKAENGTISFDLGDNATFGLNTQKGNVSKKVGNTIDIEGNNSNINTLVDNGKVKINLNNNLNLTDGGSVTIGDTTLNSTGLTINNGPKVVKDGIDAGNKKITNVADGNVAKDSKDAVNGSQLYATNQNITNVSNNVTNLKNEVAKGWNVNTSKSGTGNVSGNSLTNIKMGDTVTFDAGNNINITQNNGTISIATSLTPNFSSVDTGNLTVRGGGKVDFGGNALTNVGNGTNGTDAVNLSQLNASTAAAKTEVKAGNNVNVTEEKGANNQTVYTVNADKSTVTNGSDKVKVTETAGANNVTNYSVDLSDEAKNQLKKEESVNSTTSNLIVTQNTTNDTGGKNYSVTLNNTLDLTSAGSVKLGDTLLNSTGLTITGGPSVTKGGINAGDKKITNVSEGTLSADSKDAVNGSQLYAAAQNITNITNEVAKGWNLTTAQSGTGKVSGNTTEKVAIGETVTIEAGDNINITQSGKKVTIATSNNITVGTAGKDGQNGIDGTIGVNGKDGSTVVINGKDGSIGLTGPK